MSLNWHFSGERNESKEAGRAPVLHDYLQEHFFSLNSATLPFFFSSLLLELLDGY